MTLLLDRSSSPHIQRLDSLIDVLVTVISDHEGVLGQREAMRLAARESGVSISELPFVVNSAVAEKRIKVDLRAGTLAVVSE